MTAAVRARGLLFALAAAGSASAWLACAASAPRAGGGPDAIVTIELTSSSGAPRVSVVIEAAGDPSGTTVFQIEDRWGGVSGFDQGIRDVAVHGRGGAALAVEHPDERTWTVRHAPSEPLALSYALAPTQPFIPPSSSSYYKPVVQPSIFHAIGHAFLIVPRHLAGDAPRSIDFRWRGFEEAGWKTVSSFGVDPRGTLVNRSMDQFVHAVFFAGAIRVHRVPARGGELVVAIAGDGWLFRDEEFVASARSVVDAERAFFDDGAPYFLISVLPIGDMDPSTHSIGGTALVSSFALFMMPNTRLASEPQYETEGHLGVRWLLAHELFHHWNGGVIERAQPDELTYWFSEGFTDFYARRLLYRAGLITIADYARSLEASLSAYYASPVLHASNQEMAASFWTNDSAQKLAYRRGDAVALAVDARIRATSGGARSLDDVMKDLCRRGRETGERVSTDSLIATFAKETSPDFAELVRQWVVTGDAVSIEPDALSPCLSMRFDGGAPRIAVSPGAGDTCRARL